MSHLPQHNHPTIMVSIPTGNVVFLLNSYQPHAHAPMWSMSHLPQHAIPTIKLPLGHWVCRTFLEFISLLCRSTYRACRICQTMLIPRSWCLYPRFSRISLECISHLSPCTHMEHVTLCCRNMPIPRSRGLYPLDTSHFS